MENEKNVNKTFPGCRESNVGIYRGYRSLYSRATVDPLRRYAPLGSRMSPYSLVGAERTPLSKSNSIYLYHFLRHSENEL